MRTTGLKGLLALTMLATGTVLLLILSALMRQKFRDEK